MVNLFAVTDDQCEAVPGCTYPPSPLDSKPSARNGAATVHHLDAELAPEDFEQGPGFTRLIRRLSYSSLPACQPRWRPPKAAALTGKVLATSIPAELQLNSELVGGWQN